MNNTPNLASAYRPRVRNLLATQLASQYGKVKNAWMECEKQDSKAYVYLAIATYSVLLHNEYVINKVLSAIYYIRQNKKMFRQELKKEIKSAEKLARKYDNMICDIMGMQEDMIDSLDDIADRYKEAVEHKAQIFYYSLKQAMDSEGVENSDIRTNIEFCAVLMEIAKCSQDSMEESNLLLRERLQVLGYLRLDKLYNAWERVRYLVNVKYPKKVELNTPRCKQACGELTEEMNNLDMIAKIMNH